MIASVACQLDFKHLAIIGGTAGVAAGLVGVVTASVPVLSK